MTGSRELLALLRRQDRQECYGSSKIDYGCCIGHIGIKRDGGMFAAIARFDDPKTGRSKVLSNLEPLQSMRLRSPGQALYEAHLRLRRLGIIDILIDPGSELVDGFPQLRLV